jgi:hypothetical protein
MKWILGLLTVFIVSSSFKPEEKHDFYVSITELNLVNDTIQISMRIFTDDLADALKQENKKPFAMSKASAYDENQNAIVRILDRDFSVGSATKKSAILWLGHEYEGEVTWIYGETKLPEGTSLLFVKNKLLIDLYEKQQNMIHLKRGEEYETELCSERKKEVRFML